MNALVANGQFDINGFIVCPTTSISDLQHSGLNMRYSCSPGINTSSFIGQSIVLVDQAPFLVEIYFLHESISSMLLRPYIQYPPKMTDLWERQQLRYIACSRWLFVRLGPPHAQVPGECRYQFEWGRMSSVAHLLPRDQCDAGYIAVQFKI